MSIRRDYKPASTWQRRRQTVRRHGLLVATLVLIGLFGGLLAYIKGDRPQSAATAPAATDRPTGAVAPTTPKPVVETAPAPAKPKYDFYTELPRRQIDIQREERKPRGAPAQPPARTQPAAEPPRKPATPPAAPKKSATTPTVAATTTSGSRPAMPARSANPPRAGQPPPSSPSAGRRSTIAVQTE